MKKKLIFIVVGVALLLIFLSCERVNKQAVPENTTTVLDIPASYGSLIAVTTDAKFPGWGQMWFSDSTGKITIVRVSWADKIMIKNPITISRTPEPTSMEGKQ